MPKSLESDNVSNWRIALMACNALPLLTASLRGSGVPLFTQLNSQGAAHYILQCLLVAHLLFKAHTPERFYCFACDSSFWCFTGVCKKSAILLFGQNNCVELSLLHMEPEECLHILARSKTALV